MSSRIFTFIGHAGDELAARLDMPVGAPLATAIFAHCFTCSKDSIAARRISTRLCAMGIAVLRFDFTGLGESDGEFSDTGFSNNVEDLVLAANHLADEELAPTLLIGHSLGGSAVIMAAADIPGIKAVATLGAPFDPAHVTENFKSAVSAIQTEGYADVDLGGRKFKIRKEFLEDVAASNLEPVLGDFKKALMVLHAPTDTIVGIENASHIFLAAKHPKSFVTLDNADHLLTRPADAEYAAEVIAAWSARYLDIRTPAAPVGAPEGIVRVTEADPDGFLNDVNAGPLHHTLADEPETYGGTNQGMSPYQFLSAGLGACTSMTLRMYARRKRWPLAGISVDVIHDKVHGQDCQTCETDDKHIDQFRRTISLEGDLSDDQRQRLLEIADKCPVHRTFEAEISVLTALADDS